MLEQEDNRDLIQIKYRKELMILCVIKEGFKCLDRYHAVMQSLITI